MPDTAPNLATKPATAPALFPPNITGTLSEAERARMIQRALDILAGRVEPDVLVTPPEVQAEIDAVKREHPRTATTDFIRLITDKWNRSYYYGGNVVAALDTPKGCVVLACGDEIGPLLQAIPRKDVSRVFTTHPTDPNCLPS